MNFNALKATLFLLCLTSTNLFAGLTDTFGIGPRNISLGNATSSVDSGTYSARSNPAGLVNAKSPQLSLGAFNSSLSLDSTNSTRTSALSSGMQDDNYDVAKAEDLRNFTLGLTFPLGKYLYLGIAGILPANYLAKIYSYSGNEANYLLYSDRHIKPELYTSVGIPLLYGVSIGGGVFYSARVEGTAQMAFNTEDADSRMALEVKPVYVPYGGILLQRDLNTKIKFKLGAMYRKEQDAKTHIDINVHMKTSAIKDIPFSTKTQVVAFYDPAILAFGTSVNVGNLALYGGFENHYWSKYISPTIDLAGSDLNDLTGGSIDRDLITLQDVQIYKVGLEILNALEFKDSSVSLRTGFEYHTSALPNNPTSLAVVDTESTVVSAGGGLKMKKLGHIISHPFSLNSSLSWNHLKKRKLQSHNMTAMVGGDTYTVTAGGTFEF